jgi:hypothetical protein
LKVGNSFAFEDTFDGVDEPLITLSGTVSLTASVSAVVIEIGVTGNIQFIVTIDFYDPYPTTSGGLIRPFELLSMGTDPLKWFEFDVTISVGVELFVLVGIFTPIADIIIFEFSCKIMKL